MLLHSTELLLSLAYSSLDSLVSYWLLHYGNLKAHCLENQVARY
jgi:hypothetical protein